MIYEPAEDSYLLEKSVKKYSKGKSFLDMGAGSGIQSKAAKSLGSKSVLAVDIGSEVVKSLQKKGLRALQSNLFEKVKGTFDLIAFNPPYLPHDKREDKESQRTTTGGKKGDEITLKFLKQAPKHLAQDGIILLLLSSLTPKERIISLLKKMSIDYKIIESQKIFMESLEVWEIRRINKVKK